MNRNTNGTWDIFVHDREGRVLFGDLDGDGDVDVADIMLVAGRWGCSCDDASCATALLTSNQTETAFPLPAATLRLQSASPVASGKTFTVAVEIEGATDLGGFQFDIAFDPAVVQVEDVTLGDLLGSTGRSTTPLGPVIDNAAGAVTFGGFSFGDQPGPSGDGVLAVVTWTALGVGSSPLHLENVQVVDVAGQKQPAITEDGRAMVGLSQRIYLPVVGRE
ncbi:MAG: hypothetical protein H8E35_12070 [Ardenticatenia bacterium]|nr:hypothetical protein [Ardenticatenia bacterium]